MFGGVLRGRGASVLDLVEGRPLQRLRVVPADQDPAPVGVGPRVVPPVGPLQARPQVTSVREATEMLRTALDGVSLGRADRAVLTVLRTTQDPAVLVVLASIIERARVEGPAPSAALVVAGGGMW